MIVGQDGGETGLEKEWGGEGGGGEGKEGGGGGGVGGVGRSKENKVGGQGV